MNNYKKNSLSTTKSVFYFEISGKDFNDEQPPNKLFISVTLLVFHLKISGKDFNDEQSANK